MSLNIKKIPVFVFPNSLKFYLGSKASHKQLLTLYNPYDFPVRFKVLSTAPNKYAVIDPEGSIGPRTLVDIVIRHTMPTIANCNFTDKFRISMQDHTTKQILGKREIDAILLQGERDDLSSDGDFHSVPFIERPSTSEDQRIFVTNRSLPVTHSTNYVIAIVIGLVCVVTLLLPTQQEVPHPSNIPTYLHVSVNFKLVLAYVLGLVSMVIFKP
ncbi:motile sperm domain-containing protein 1-like [Anoplophora glabripennis]|uniref:motile sperm domain-containing protein 1-like n=1 Tax=Anoplophora glabripennis TaxID=217634 RepID=UPI0008759522|nr:motile sperm domain-containing protein 1-like [Anoplophora glabripennis]XP_018573271.1 motile sperm domain-containing protein 1-like [Anoplophora glabripennis]